MKLFISFDFTAFPCDRNQVVSVVKQFSGQAAQFKYNGKPMISTYEGGCLGNDGWNWVKGQTGGYFMPFISGLENNFGNWNSIDTWYCWGCAWPQGSKTIDTAGDEYYISQLGSKFATTVSVWMFSHYTYKNFLENGDNWLVNTRWEGLMKLRDKITFIEMVTWNDYGESDYFGPRRGDKPAGTTWIDNSPHTPWFDFQDYYIKWFKTGVQPTITKDALYYWARPHPASATATSDSVGKPQCSGCTKDILWAVVFATAPGSTTLSIGSSKQTFTNIVAGVNKLQIPLAPGQITVSLTRNGKIVLSKADKAFTYSTSTKFYNYNAYVGSVSA